MYDDYPLRDVVRRCRAQLMTWVERSNSFMIANLVVELFEPEGQVALLIFRAA